MNNVLTNEEVKRMDEYFRVLNYMSVGQLYLMDNPLLRRKLTIDDIKPKVVGHWGTSPGQNFVYMHLNRVIKKYDLDMMYISGPGHGGQAMVANAYLEGTYGEIYPEFTDDEEGLKKLFKQFSFPGGVSSHVAPETPGSINEGGELGYSLAHAFGAVLDNPTLIAACVIGDGEAETGALATSWHLNKFLNPKTDGDVLPILHLNGFKIANPTVLARISDEELDSLFRGYGWMPYYVNGDDEVFMHNRMANVLEEVIGKIKEIKKKAQIGDTNRPMWPMIILRSPKGWTGPKVVDGKKIEGSFRAHQVPILVSREHPENLPLLEEWLKSYKVDDLFDEKGSLIPELKDLNPIGDKRMSANKHANGGLLLKELNVPDFRNYQVMLAKPGSEVSQDMIVLGKFIRDIIVKNLDNFRVFGPDEALSNRLNAIFERTNRKWNASVNGDDEYLDVSGRVMDSYLSEHVCQGMLEGYLLTGRHGFFHSYEAFVRIVDSMVSQHAKWLKVSNELLWRKEIASLNYVLTSHIWQQDHNGYTHQDPGFLNHMVTKKADTVRIYLPPDANCLLSCFDHCVRSKNYINVIVASKHPSIQWLSMDKAIEHCTKGIGTWDFASNDDGNPDVVMASCGDTPTLEAIAAISILRKMAPELKIRYVNVVDLMRLQSDVTHPHGMSDEDYDKLFTKDKPIIFAFHGYPNLIHELTYKRHNDNLHVHGYLEEGTITTPFDMRVQNEIDRYHLVMDVMKYVDKVKNKDEIMAYCIEKLTYHHDYIREVGEDIPEVKDWKWE